MNPYIILNYAEEDVLAKSMAKDRASCGGWDAPTTPSEYLMWIEDEAQVQIEQAVDYPEEADDRLPYAIRLSAWAVLLRANGVQPISAPWERVE